VVGDAHRGPVHISSGDGKVSVQMVASAFNLMDLLKSFANLHQQMALGTTDPKVMSECAAAARAYRHAANLVNEKLDLRLVEQDAASQEG
jgi:hypothetical protein